MSILIPGMEMPKVCICCKACFAAFDAFICTLERRRIYDDEPRPDWCPIIELPPHGRLGDLDAFESIKYELPDGQKAFNRGFHSGVQYVQRLIMDAPTIIPADGGDAQ